MDWMSQLSAWGIACLLGVFWGAGAGFLAWLNDDGKPLPWLVIAGLCAPVVALDVYIL